MLIKLSSLTIKVWEKENVWNKIKVLALYSKFVQLENYIIYLSKSVKHFIMIKLIKKIFLIGVLGIIVISCSDSKSSKSKKCDDMKSYNKGKQEGQNNNMYADCNYYWEMDKQWVDDKSCFCKGYNDYNKY